MVAGLIIPIALIGLAIVFRKDITNFLSGGITGLGDSLNEAIGGIGRDAEKFGSEQQANFDQFVLDTQKNIDQGIGDANANINQFIKDAQFNFDSNIAGITTGFVEAGTGITKGVADTNKAIDQFIKDSQQNIINGVSGIQQGFEDFISNPFGGQKNPKEIPQTKEKTQVLTGRGKSGSFTKQVTNQNGKLDILVKPDVKITETAIKPIGKDVTPDPKEQSEITAIKEVTNRFGGKGSRR